jgi:hypothetical protein
VIHNETRSTKYQIYGICMRSCFTEKVWEMAFGHVSPFSCKVLYRVATNVLLPSAVTFTFVLPELSSHLQYCRTLLHILQHNTQALNVPRDPFDLPSSHDRIILRHVLWDFSGEFVFPVCGRLCAHALSMIVVQWCNYL